MSEPKAPKKRVLHRERVAKRFAGKTTSPREVAVFLGVDRAAACRILQTLVKRGEAGLGQFHGDYAVFPK